MATERLPKDRALSKLREQLAAIPCLKRLGQFSAEFKKWHRDTQVAIERIFGKEGRHLRDFNGVEYSLAIFSTGTSESAFERAFRDGLDSAQPVLESFISEIQEYWSERDELTAESGASTALSRLTAICARFHLVVRQLKARHDDRPTLEVEDEFDVQDLLHALLRVEFEDIRSEEWVPSYAGGASRADFLLKPERCVVEAKRTRTGLSARDFGDQLIIDTQRYQSHPDCDQLFCFIYDPEGRIGNPRGLETDLSGARGSVTVTVVVAPRGG